MPDNKPDAPSLGRCPICRKPAVVDQRPFCSRRCADLDLARWLGGGYVIGGTSLDAADDTDLDETGQRRPPGRGEEEM